MRRIVPLSSLTAGRCFTLAQVPNTPPEDDNEAHKRFKHGLSILQADMVWKVVGPEAEGVGVDSALADHVVMPGTTQVVEVPRQGYDRLVQRARETETP